MKVRQAAKVAGNAKRRGQRWGQIAKAHGISVERLRLIAEGTLNDPAFIVAIWEAWKNPELRELVSPAAREALARPMRMIAELDGSPDDLFATLLDALDKRQQPSNRNFARQFTLIEQVTSSLDDHLRLRREADMWRGRSSRKSLEAARKKKRENADTSARELLNKVQTRKPGAKKTMVYRRVSSIATAKMIDALKEKIEQLSANPIDPKKAIARGKKKIARYQKRELS